MISELERRLSEAFHEDAQRARLTHPEAPATSASKLDVDDVRLGVAEGTSHPRRRWMLVAAATIVVLAVGLLALAAAQDSDSVQTDTVPGTPSPSTSPATTSPSSTRLGTAPPSAPSTTTAPSTTLLASIETVPETPPPTTTPAVSTTTLVLPLRFDPSLRPDLYPDLHGSPGTELTVPSEEQELAWAVLDFAGWHGQGHQIEGALDADGIIDGEELGQGGETLIGCAERQLSISRRILERAVEARSTLILAGVPAAEITPRSVASQMTIDVPAIFDIDPVEYRFLFLICGGISDEQARVIANM